MRLTKFGHACIRVEQDDTVLVVDPGGWTSPEAVDGATALLLTHEHPDHVHPEHLRRTTAPIWTIEAVARMLREQAPDVAERVTVVAPGESFDAGLPVRAVGELHAVIHPDLPRFDNSGFLLEAGGTTVFHPGDALTGPDRPVDVLCAPVSAPWLKASEAVDFARAVGAARNLAIHDRVYSEEGLGIVDGHFGRLLGEDQSYVRLAEGSDL
ncbi:MBL fold metallo-hydrolase [Nocardioides aestuarii]|uniref:MBL fold metallo-hydrolase n=1 Tax=Nocardioides aestuarii TaxID=252231 RepID=A0ABW4TPC0_9ACTN